MSTSCIFKNFIDETFIQTNNPNDKISKAQMNLLFKEKYPTKNLTDNQISISLKEKNIKYDAQVRKHNIRGVYTGLKQLTD